MTEVKMLTLNKPSYADKRTKKRFSNLRRRNIWMGASFVACFCSIEFSQKAYATCSSTTTNSGVSNSTLLSSGVGNCLLNTNTGTINISTYDNTIVNNYNIDSLVNNGTLISVASSMLNGGNVVTLTNTGSISMSNDYAAGIFNQNGTISTLNAGGSVTATGGTGTRGLLNYTNGIITTLNYSATYTGNNVDIQNTNSIVNMYNLRTTNTVVYNGNLPTNYFMAITDATNYGKISVSGAASTITAFGIDPNSYSNLAATTYQNVLYGLTNSNLSSLTGVTTNGAYSWTLALDGGGYYDLTLVDLSSNISSGTTTNASQLIGNPTFSGGTLVMNQNGESYGNNFTVTGGTTSTIDQDGNTSTFAGTFTGSGNLTITNSGNGGKIIFTGTNSYSGETTVNSGATVAVNGSMAGQFNVNSGGILQGNGSFGNGAFGGTISGILAPGNSIGTITSNGALTLASGSTYQVEVNAAGQSDKTVVNGTATLQGGKVSVVSYDNAPAYLPTKKYTILTATGGVSGRFDGASIGYSFLTPTLAYGSNDVTLGFALTPFSTVAKNINQRNVGNALTIAALGPVNSLGAPILNALFSGNYENAQAVMDTVSGSGLAGVQSTAMQVGEMASSSVSDQIAFWRSGETMDATGRTSQEGNNPRNFLAYAPTETKVPKKGPINLKGPAGSLSAAVAPRTFRAWGSMFGGGANYLSDAGRGAAASNIGYYGGLIGVDYQIQPNILVGVALGGSSSNFNVGSLSTNGNLTGFHAGVYGAYTMGNSYIALNETFSAYSNQTNRKAGGYALMPYEQLSAQFGSTEFRTRAEVGHGVLMGGLKATPFIAAEIAAYQSNAFSEQSSIYASTFALKNNGQGVNSLPTFAGLRLSNAVTLSNGWRLAPVGSVAYVHEFFPQRQFNNMLISMPGADFNVAGPRSTYNLVQTKVGAQLNLNEKLALFTDFQGEFSPVSQSYGGKGGVKYVW
jgi:outer membrane autotransporter protein